jgi:cytochrome b pre-mRNA-processing protein 3
MILGLFRGRDRNLAIVDGLYAAVAGASRNPVLYRDIGVPDTIDGRFDSLTLHAFLVVRRLRELPPPADDLAQDLVNAIFRQFDAALRELGVGDLTVPKRMKDMAAAFAGRTKAYEDAFGDDVALSGALRRNVFGGTDAGPGQAEALLGYVRESAERLSGQSFDDFVAGRPAFATIGQGDAP